MPNVFVAARLFAFGSSGDSVTQVSDDSGHQLTRERRPGRSETDAARRCAVPSYTGAPAPLQMVATEPGKAGDLTATVRRGKRGGAMDLTLPGLQASLQAGARPARSTTFPSMTLPRRSATARALPALRRHPDLGARWRGEVLGGRSPASQRMVDFQTTSTKGGDDTVSFAHGRAFAIDHDGAPAALSLTLSGFGADGLPVAVRVPKTHLGRGERLSAAPTNWRRLGSVRSDSSPRSSMAVARPGW